MKNLIILLLLSVALTSCYRVQPNAGEESVLIYQPVIFGHGGVDPTPVSTGAEWCVVSTDHREFNITPVTYQEDFTNMIPKDNTPVNFSVYPKLQIKEGKTPILYKKFKEKWYENNIQEPFRTMVRDKASKYTMFELASNRDISLKLQQELFDDLTALVKKLELPVDVNSVTVGAITPPDAVLTETKNTAAQNQSKLTQTARASAELARKQAETNKAIADQAYQKQMGMTIEEYLHLRQLEIEKEKVELIKDKQNVSIIFGGNGLPVTYPVK